MSSPLRYYTKINGTFTLVELEAGRAVIVRPEALQLGKAFDGLSGEAYALTDAATYSFIGVSSRTEWERVNGPVSYAMPTEQDAKQSPGGKVNALSWTRITEANRESLFGGVPPAYRNGSAFACGEPADRNAADEDIFTCCVTSHGEHFARKLTLSRFKEILG